MKEEIIIHCSKMFDHEVTKVKEVQEEQNKLIQCNEKTTTGPQITNVTKLSTYIFLRHHQSLLDTTQFQNTNE